MKKRLLAALLSVAMVATLMTGCGNNAQNTENEETGSSQPSESETDTTASNGGLSVEPYLYYPFDSADEGWKVVVADTGKTANNAYDVANMASGIARTIVDGDMSLANLTKDGVKGKSIFMNRDYAIDLNLKPTKTNEYTISYWVCAAGLADFAPTLQFGSNIGYADNAGNEVAWMNVTSAFSQQYPVVWSRNEVFDGPTGVDCWPWMYQVGDPALRGYKEWAMITIVVTGEEQQSPIEDGGTTVGAKLYVNGELKYDSQDNYLNATYFDYTWDCSLAPGLMNPTDTQTFESYFGINYWDTMYKGYLDEFYVFDKAISEEDIQALYALGDPSNPPELDSEGDPKENPKVLLGENSIGFNNYTQAFWTAFSDIWEVKEGTSKTVSFKQYHTNLSFANYMNAVLVLQGTATGHSADPANAMYAEGYNEYGVFRLDNYGWLGADNTGSDAGLAALGWELSSDWNWDTFKNDTHDALVEITVTNHGKTADVVMKLTAADGTVHTQSYKNITVNGPLYMTLTCEKSCLDEITVK